MLTITNPQRTFGFGAADEKLIRSLRVGCKLAECGAPKSRTKFVNRLAMSGYWTLGVSWETTILAKAVSSVDANGSVLRCAHVNATSTPPLLPFPLLLPTHTCTRPHTHTLLTPSRSSPSPPHPLHLHTPSTSPSAPPPHSRLRACRLFLLSHSRS